MKSVELAVKWRALWGMPIQTDGDRMLVLHIGTGKAGSTTIQSFLKENRPNIPFGQLEAFGIGNAWKIAAASGTDRSRRYWLSHTKGADESGYDAWRSALWQDAALQFTKSDFRNVIASSEYIFGQLGENHDAILDLKQNLERIFGDIRIIVYFRNQVDYVKSVYAQRIKGSARETMRFEEYISKLDDIDIPIHYANRLRVWITIFGKENICPVVFDKQNFPNGNLIEDFCNRAGLPFGKDLGAWKNVSKNVSPSVSQLEALRLLNIAGIKGGEPKAFAAYVIGLFKPKSDYTTEYDSSIIGRVSDGNKWLNDTFFSEFAVKLPVST